MPKTILVTSSCSEQGNFEVFCDKERIAISGGKGLCLVCFEKDIKETSIKKLFDCNDPSSVSALCSTLEKLKDQNGTYVIMGIKGDNVWKGINSECKRLISCFGSREIERVGEFDSWALVTKVGEKDSLHEYRRKEFVEFSHTL